MNSPLVKRKRVMQVEYDFIKDGGAVGELELRGGILPPGALVDFSLLDVQTGLTSGGAATAALSLVSAADVKDEAALTSYTTGTKACNPNKTATNSVKISESTKLKLTIAIAPLTAGKFVAVLEYFVTE